MMRITIELDEDTSQAVGRIGESQRLTHEQTVAYLLDRTLFGVTRRMNVAVQEYKPQATLIMLDESADDVIKHFRCPNCGNIVFDYYGGVKLIMPGRFDRENMLIDGEEVDWFGKLGKPLIVECPGRVIVQRPNGVAGKVRCASKFYKLGVVNHAA